MEFREKNKEYPGNEAHVCSEGTIVVPHIMLKPDSAPHYGAG
jgi:hypothetical protein